MNQQLTDCERVLEHLAARVGVASAVHARVFVGILYNQDSRLDQLACRSLIFKEMGKLARNLLASQVQTDQGRFPTDRLIPSLQTFRESLRTPPPRRGFFLSEGPGCGGSQASYSVFDRMSPSSRPSRSG